jgi:peroxisome proliferator-activated receptor gamma coactivator-related protein 1
MVNYHLLFRIPARALFSKVSKSFLVETFSLYDSTDHLRSRSPDQPPREVQRRKQRQVEERRVVYVGRITEGITRADLRKRFETFGPIEEISVHFRDRGDNYGFVTFRNKADAFAAIEQGNDDTSYPKVDLCFGGRRTFCKEKYSDLDSRSLHTVGSTSRRGTALADDNDDVEQQSEKVSTKNDFDTLLKRARAGIRNNK